MRLSFAAPLLLSLLAAAVPAQAASVTDAVGDFLPTYVGPLDGDLDVTSFSVDFDSVASVFTLGATMAGAINPATAGIYVIGVNTGTGPAAPFGALGHPDVRFNQAIVVQKNGTGTVGANAITATISGNSFSAFVPLSFLPSTGYSPLQYGFNLWPRIGLGNNNQISDFSPENAVLSISPVPEPASWAMMIAGFGVLGAVLRGRRTGQPQLA